MSRLKSLCALVVGTLMTSCGSGSGTTVTVLGYTVLIKAAPPVSALVGSSLPIGFTVSSNESDGSSTPASGKVITVTVTAGGGTVEGASAVTLTTGPDGSVAMTWVLGSTVGTQTLRGSVSATQYLDVNVTATPPPTQLAVVTQPATAAITGVILTRQPTVQLKDANGNNAAVTGVAVLVSIASGGGTIGGTTSVSTDANGLATFSDLSLSGATGTVTLKFTATLNGTSVNVTSTGIAVTASNQLAITTAPTSVPGNGIPLFTQPMVQLQDGTGTALHQAGVAVAVSVASGIGTIGTAPGGVGSLTANTDANGVATFHDLVLTGVGANTLRFSAPGFAAATTGTLNVVLVPAATILTNSVQLGPFVANIGDAAYYTFTVPAGTVSMDVATFSGTGNIDLYIRRNLDPTATDFDCHAHVAGPSQICTFNANLSGQYFAIVKATTAFAGSMIRANAYTAGCTPKATLALGVTVNGLLSVATGCFVEQSQLLHDRYSLVVPTTQAVAITSSAASDTYRDFIAWRLPDEQVNYYSQTVGVAPVTTPPILFGPGPYTIMVGDASGTNATRNYSLLVSSASAQPVGCSNILAYGPVNATLSLTAADCAGTTPATYSHRVSVVVGAGQTLTVTMSSTAFDPLVKLLLGSTLSAGSVVTQDDNSGGGTSARMTYTNNDPNSAAQFTIELTSAGPSATGLYTFSLAYSPANYNLRGTTNAPVAVPGAPASAGPVQLRAPTGGPRP